MNGLIMSGATDPGRQRDRNEDAYTLNPEIGVAVLADGMGGHLAGEIASATAVEVITRVFRSRYEWAPPHRRQLGREAALEAIRDANDAILDISFERPECAGMGTTVVVAVFEGNKLHVAHVGDSRLYRLRAGRLRQLTRDHSCVQELIRRGLLTTDQARHDQKRHLVTRSLGAGDVSEAETHTYVFREHDLYLLCSDGLTDMLTDDEIAAILTTSAGDLNTVAARLVEAANTSGGRDNITVALVRTGKRFERPKLPPPKQLPRPIADSNDTQTFEI